jgi:transmembrane sensor
MPLSQWATEMQRYHAEKIQVSPKADELQVVGLFPLDDLEQSLAMLRNVLPISTRRSGWNGILIDVSA